jgi:hypothetical protein
MLMFSGECMVLVEGKFPGSTPYNSSGGKWGCQGSLVGHFFGFDRFRTLPWKNYR